MKKAYKLLLLTLLIVALCALMASCGEKPGPEPNMCVHTYDGGTITTPATCIAKGTRTYTCTLCGDTYTQNDVSMTEHVYATEGTVTKEPSCTELGVMSYPCTTPGCAKADTKAIVMIDHVADDTLVSDDVLHWYPCTMCNQKIDYYAHTFDEENATVKTEATCLAKGLVTMTCTECGIEKDFETAKTEHAWDDGEIVTAPSATDCKSGRTELTCTEDGCGATKLISTAGVAQHTLVYESVTVSGAEQLKFSCSVCNDSWTSAFSINADGTNILQDYIDWNAKDGYASSPLPALRDGAYEILLAAGTSTTTQAEFFFPSKKNDKLLKDFSAANGSRAFYTISLKAPAAGLFDGVFSVKMTNEEGTPRWTPVHAVDILVVAADGTITGKNDTEGNTIQLGKVTSTDWTDIFVAIELEGAKIYFTYIVDGALRGTAVLENTLHNKAATGTYFTGTTATPNTGILIDNMTWSHSNAGEDFLPIDRHLVHDWVAGDTVAPSTDTCDPGYTEYVCSVCGGKKRDDFVQSEIDHTWDEFNVKYEKHPVAEDTEAGVEEEDGKWTLTCKDCGWRETVTGSFADHDHAFDANAGVENEDNADELIFSCTVPGCEETKAQAKDTEDAAE